MRRRDLITLLGGAAAWPLAARAQQAAIPVIGYLDAGAPETSARLAAAFRKGLAETGYAEGRNVAIEYRWARNEYDRLPEMASDLVRRQVIVIAAMGGTPTALAAKAATTTIPIVFGFGGDPVQTGLVASLNRPGGNITGVVTMNVELAAKRLGLLHELVPEATRFAVLVNASNSATVSLTRDALAAAAPAGWQIEFLAVSTNRDLSATFAGFAQKRVDAVMVAPELLFCQPSRSASYLGGSPRRTHHLSESRVCGSRRADELRIELYRHASPSRHLHWSHPQGRETCRPTGDAADHVRVRHQPANRPGTRHRRTADAPRPRRRGDRVRRRQFITLLGAAAA